MGKCDKCGSTGGGNHQCATKTSQIEYDGGSLCWGWSGKSLNGLIRALSKKICDLTTAVGDFSVSTDDVSYNGGTLTTWITNTNQDIKDIQDILDDLDGTKVIYYTDTTTSYNSSGATTYGNLKTFSIPANTWEEDFDYLLVEFMLTNARISGKSSTSKYRVKIGSNTVLNPTLSANPSVLGVFASIKLVKNGAAVVSGDYVVHNTKPLQNIGTEYGKTTDATGLTFTGAIALTIDGYNQDGAISCDMIRITKFKKLIS